ncbi:voltage-dependent T-type calcium channel subunit alpha-1G-like [Chrysoperla carnea]|uniref:voltage-dependent T-type calcium channel subunit alpha-1G-like n=1 Tax=Chrysoperla carnea TaxID=189513 RepID=UPI001D087EBE|nr:voltage-dependent T-type calcium channel subunit alpha-1G-like [Chrysoperla carnea]
MALHYYGYQSCRRGSETATAQRRNVPHQSAGRMPSEPPSESGESGGAMSDLDSDSGGCSGGSSSTSGSGSGGSSEDPANGLPYPGIAPIALRYLGQTTRPRNWCLALISNPYPF